jgi:hypothetical protein
MWKEMSLRGEGRRRGSCEGIIVGVFILWSLVGVCFELYLPILRNGNANTCSVYASLCQNVHKRKKDPPAPTPHRFPFA